MIDSYFREPYQRVFVDPAVKGAMSWNCSPAAATTAALFAGISTLPLLYFGYSYAACGALLLSGYLDTLDGSIARAQNIATPQGAALDIVSDRCVEAAVVCGLYAADPESRGWLCILMLTSILLCVTTFLVVGIFENRPGFKSFYYSPGLMERSEAFAFFTAMMLLPSYFVPLSILFIVLVGSTAIVRLRSFVNN